MPSTHEFVKEVVELDDQLRPLLKEHLEDNEELLPHVLMGDISRYVIRESLARPSRGRLQRLLDKFEQALESGSTEVQELVVVSFVENLAGEAEAIRSLKPLMKSKLLSEVDRAFGE